MRFFWFEGFDWEMGGLEKWDWDRMMRLGAVEFNWFVNIILHLVVGIFQPMSLLYNFPKSSFLLLVIHNNVEAHVQNNKRIWPFISSFLDPHLPLPQLQALALQVPRPPIHPDRESGSRFRLHPITRRVTNRI